MYSITLLQKSYVLSKLWVWEKSPNVGGRIKRVAQGLEVDKKLFSTFHYIYFQEIKRVLYMFHVTVNLQIRFSLLDNPKALFKLSTLKTISKQIFMFSELFKTFFHYFLLKYITNMQIKYVIGIHKKNGVILYNGHLLINIFDKLLL